MFISLTARSGAITLTTGSLRDTSRLSRYWLSITYLNTNEAYFLDFNSDTINPSNTHPRERGFLLRCTAL